MIKPFVKNASIGQLPKTVMIGFHQEKNFMSKKKIGAIVQARMGSERLPGKVMADINGKPLLEHLIERLKAVKRIDIIIIATTDKERDKPILKLSEQLGVYSFAGDEDDVLNRFYHAAKKFNIDVVVRITADDPLKDPKIISKVLETYMNSNVDYVTNVLKRTYPDSMVTEIFPFSVLEKAFKGARVSHHREHVTPYIYENPQLFSILNVEAEGIYKRPDLRIQVDTPEDLKLVRSIFRLLQKPNKLIELEDIIELFEKRPDLHKINSHIKERYITAT